MLSKKHLNLMYPMIFTRYEYKDINKKLRKFDPDRKVRKMYTLLIISEKPDGWLGAHIYDGLEADGEMKNWFWSEMDFLSVQNSQSKYNRKKKHEKRKKS